MSTGSRCGQSLLNLGFELHIVPQRPPHCCFFHGVQGRGICTGLLEPRQKKKKASAVDGAAARCYSRRARCSSRAGCGIFQKQLCARGADRAPEPKGFLSPLFHSTGKKKIKKPLPPLPHPPSAYLACRPDPLKLAHHQKYPLCLPLLRTSRRRCREASSTSKCCRILFHLLHIPNEGAGEGGGLPFWLCGTA